MLPLNYSEAARPNCIETCPMTISDVYEQILHLSTVVMYMLYFPFISTPPRHLIKLWEAEIVGPSGSDFPKKVRYPLWKSLRAWTLFPRIPCFRCRIAGQLLRFGRNASYWFSFFTLSTCFSLSDRWTDEAVFRHRSLQFKIASETRYLTTMRLLINYFIPAFSLIHRASAISVMLWHRLNIIGRPPLKCTFNGNILRNGAWLSLDLKPDPVICSRRKSKEYLISEQLRPCLHNRLSTKWTIIIR
jgi:hypothetical protein